MKRNKDSREFTWYATHPEDGDLILVIPPVNNFKHCYIYAPRIIAERLRGKMNPALALELNLGPCGLIPRAYYEEAGFMARTPFKIRLLALVDSSTPLTDETLQEHDGELTHFILAEWNAQKSLQNPLDSRDTG